MLLQVQGSLPLAHAAVLLDAKTARGGGAAAGAKQTHAHQRATAPPLTLRQLTMIVLRWRHCSQVRAY